MATVARSEADTQLSQLVEEILAGGEVVISRDGKVVAKLVPLEQVTPSVRTVPHPGPRFGLLRGRVRMDERFDEPLPEDIMRAFRGEDS